MRDTHDDRSDTCHDSNALKMNKNKGNSNESKTHVGGSFYRTRDYFVCIVFIDATTSVRH